jgi:hypothetical protein
MPSNTNEESAATSRNRVFTVDLRTRNAIRKASLGEGKCGTQGLLIEGTLGMLKKASFVDGLILEVIGTSGVLRIDLTSQELLPLRDAQGCEIAN